MAAHREAQKEWATENNVGIVSFPMRLLPIRDLLNCLSIITPVNRYTSYNAIAAHLKSHPEFAE